MSITIDYTHAYIFIGGMFIGKLTNIFSDLIITGLVLYIVTPEKFTQNRWESVKSYAWSWIKPAMDKHIFLENNKQYITLKDLPKIEILKTPISINKSENFENSDIY
uniref:Uncharacterized protein n=1 Tax=Pithovirus LCPAC302 TaxID=2506593 RepID=A0A481Z9V3_9VIRU|nr:MAG: hypothetical protein LCPAC302_00410 [Pithovirus LCPAC302]